MTERISIQHDPLDRHYTPLELARLCVRAAAEAGVNPSTILEPSCGGGAFVVACREVWPDARVTACDLDPDAKGLAMARSAIVGDFLATDLERFDLVIGNPPFTGATAISHVTKAREVGHTTGFILPWSCLGGVGRWAYHMGKRRPAAAWPICPRPWGASIRETAFFLWQGQPEATSVRWLPPWK